MDLISDSLILAEAVQRARGNVAYECQSQDASWKYVGDALRSLGMKELQVSSGRIGGKNALLSRRGLPAWATRMIATDCDEITEALRSFEWSKARGGEERR